jgi:hypothetical protein
MPDFRSAAAEFERQTKTLELLMETIRICGQFDTELLDKVGEPRLPQIPATGQTTMAAAAIVLLAAHFEEYVRQQVEEYAKSVINQYPNLEPDFKERIADAYWRASSQKLYRIRPKGNPDWAASARSVLSGLLAYPVDEDLDSFVANTLCEHENNMRWDTIKEVTGRVAIKDLSGLLRKSKELADLVGSPVKEEFPRMLQLRLNEFYELRNGIVHSIAQNSGIGASVFQQWTELLRAFVIAMADAMEASLAEFLGQIKQQGAAAKVG